MRTTVRPKDLSFLFHQVYDIDVDFLEQIYVSTKVDDRITIISTSSGQSKLDMFTYSEGIALIFIEDSNITFLPTILDCIVGLSQLPLSYVQVLELSNGRSIKYDVKDSISLGVDAKGKLIALVQIKDGIMKPLVDIGIFLREEGE